MLRVKEGIFETNVCRPPIKNFDSFQRKEAIMHINQVETLQDSLFLS